MPLKMELVIYPTLQVWQNIIGEVGYCIVIGISLVDEIFFFFLVAITCYEFG